MARKKKIDFTDVESFSNAPEGKHRVKIAKITEETSQGGNDYLRFRYEVISGDYKGSTVVENYPLTDSALWKLQAALTAAGVNCKGKVSLDLDKIEGKILEILVQNDEYDGKIRPRVAEHYKAKAVKDTDEDDEDEEDIDSDDEEEEVEEKPKAKKRGRPKKDEKPAKKAEKKPAKVDEDDKEDEVEENDSDDDDDDDDWEDDDE